MRHERATFRDRDIFVRVVVEERLAAEVHREAAMRIAFENDLKRNLVRYSRIVITAHAIGERQSARALQPLHNFRDFRWIVDPAVARERHVVVHIFAFQCNEASALARDICGGLPFSGNGDGRVLGNVNAVLCTFHTIPNKVIGHEFLHSYAIRIPLPRCCLRVSPAISTARSRMS